MSLSNTKIWIRFTLTCILLMLMSTSVCWGTHIRAGEITATRQNNQGLTFNFTITAYTDTESDVQFGDGFIDFDDGQEPFKLDDIAIDKTKVIIDGANNVAINIFKVQYTFSSPRAYTIRYQEPNRNENVVNMIGSVDTPFYVETQIVIDPFLGFNNTPVLLTPPIDMAATGAIYIHNPSAFDVDGDSLSYKIVINKQDFGIEVNGYKFPNDPTFNGQTEDGDGPATYTLDPQMGNLVWNSPGQQGEYNVAFIVEEWRQIEGQWFRLGYVTRDMQIVVEDTDNERPELEIPNDTCIVAGTLLQEFIFGDDPDEDKVKLESYSGVYELLSNPASFTPDPPIYQPVVAEGAFSWQTDCSHIRERPYAVQFKAEDDPPLGPSLVDFKTWNITVIAPAPEGLTAQAQPGKQVQLNWSEYSCPNASTMQIWRRVDTFAFEMDHCQMGIPENAGYELIAEVDITTLSFLDTNAGEGLDAGANYCYRLVAVFPQPSGGESIASEEVCAIMEADAPVITHVTVEKTDTENGEILIEWRRPFEVDPVLFPPPYTYTVFRSEGFTGNQGEIEVLSTADTTFIDSKLNTTDKAYHYRIELIDALDTKVIFSASASSVRLETTPSVGTIELNWRAEVPWSNNTQDFPYHYIYRNHSSGNENELILIDSVNVNEESFVYIDEGQFNNQPLSNNNTYCYFVTTQGSYGNELIEEPLINLSQIQCTTPNDSIPPCEPIELTVSNLTLDDCRTYLLDKPCGFTAFENILTWEGQDTGECEDDLKHYNIYYSKTGEDDYILLDQVNDATFTHGNLSSLAGCYRISAVDRSGNESILTEPICIDNCPYFALPNVFTPNNDNINDVFQAITNPESECPRFVERVQITIVNRWGLEVYNFDSNSQQGDENTNSIFINWDGKGKFGLDLSEGTYYYNAIVTFDVLDPNLKEQQFNGWIQLLR